MSNELRPSYKQTEVGVIPDDWDVINFGNMVNYTKGYAFKSSEYLNDGVRVIRVSDTTYDSIADDGAVFVSERSANTYSKWCLRENDLIFSTVGSKPPMYDSLVGKVILIPRKYSGSLLNQNAVFIRAKKYSEGFQKLLLNHFRTGRYIQYIEIIFRGNANQASITLADLFKYKLPIPPTKAEQEAIAEALSDADALIESLEQLIAKKRHIKQGAMQELLTGKKRLPGFQVKPGYKQTDLGLIPQDWDVVPMGQVGECLIGLTYSPLDVRSFGTLVLRSSNVQNGRLAFDDNVFVDMDIPMRTITRENDILICVRNGSRQLIGKCALIDNKTAGSAFGAFMSVLRSDSATFLFFQFQSNILKRQIDEVMGATINQITNKDMAAFKVIWPPTNSEQTAIATILSDMDTEITTLETKLDKTRSLKQGMMHNLLTGRIRLL